MCHTFFPFGKKIIFDYEGSSMEKKFHPNIFPGINGGIVRKDVCQTPDGKIIDPYFVYEFPTWVTAVAITEEGKVILERQYRYALDVTCYEIPGGCVDETDSSLEMAIERELLEETGYKFTNYEYLGKTSSNPSTNNNWMHMYLATGGRYDREQKLDHNEDIEVLFIYCG